ncbi:arsenic metallochaperone ArsD family protein [Brachybacterium sp. FME24]|uniref:arsenic metallochaperone ArsD family protein n=1 Tax=Brachybacterium sp. FME24 TaxID=2742605 RepID=UPI0018696732|nr:arsenic metallochaperone ArsD family protein [Brachybacterium sp. FME24]
MNDADDLGQLAGLDIFLPSPPPDAETQEAFLDDAAALALDGHPITVYLRDEDAWAFEECEPVRALLESAGDGALPVTLLGLDIVVSAAYPTTEQMTRFARAGVEARERRSAAASACGPGGAPLPREAGGFAAQLMGAAPAPALPARGPEIGERRNLMGGDIGEGLPRTASGGTTG